MKKLIFLLVISIFFRSGSFAQLQNEVPNIFINPDFPFTHQKPDSVVKYAFSSSNDSSRLNKWDYRQGGSVAILQSMKSSWNSTEKEWRLLGGKYEYGYTSDGKPILQSHYDKEYPNGGWRGCNYEGCGKKEWVYDLNGHQILRTQSYWDNNNVTWALDEIWENQYDAYGNQVLDAHKNKNSYSNNWQGSKDEYSYDSHGNQTGHVSYGWDNVYRNDWFGWQKMEYEYDNDDNLISESEYLGGWGGEEWWLPWQGFQRLEWTYDDNGNMTSLIGYEWDSINWVPKSPLFEFQYDSKGRLISEPIMVMGFYFGLNEYTYDDSHNGIIIIQYHCPSWYWDSWEIVRKYENQFDTNGNLILMVTYRWYFEDSGWYPVSKYEYSYDDRGHQTLYIINELDPNTEEWMGRLKEEKAFDKNGNLILEAYYWWNPTENNWVGRSSNVNNEPYRYEYGYDDSGNLILYASYVWDSNINNWRGSNKIGKNEWKYDSNGLLIQEIHYDWDYEFNGWKEKIKYELNYDNSGDPILQHQYAWNSDSNEWEIILRYFFHYVSSVSSKDVIAEDNMIVLFPNPTSGIINITGLIDPANIKIYNLQGQLLKSFNEVQQKIDISSLQAGVYILNINSGDKTIIRKVVRE